MIKNLNNFCTLLKTQSTKIKMLMSVRQALTNECVRSHRHAKRRKRNDILRKELLGIFSAKAREV